MASGIGEFCDVAHDRIVGSLAAGSETHCVVGMAVAVERDLERGFVPCQILHPRGVEQKAVGGEMYPKFNPAPAALHGAELYKRPHYPVIAKQGLASEKRKAQLLHALHLSKLVFYQTKQGLKSGIVHHRHAVVLFVAIPAPEIAAKRGVYMKLKAAVVVGYGVQTLAKHEIFIHVILHNGSGGNQIFTQLRNGG